MACSVYVYAADLFPSLLMASMVPRLYLLYIMLQGATIVDLSVDITPAEDYKLPPEIVAKLVRF